MRRHQKLLSVLLAAFLGLTVMLAGCTGSTTSGNDANAEKSGGLLGSLFASTKPVTVPEDTPISVVLNQAVSSASSRPGDSFDASVAEPVVVGGKTAIPRDARVKGRVVDAQASGHLSGVPRLELALASVEVNGKWYDIETSDSRRFGRNHNQHNLVFIGGSTAAGALIGGLAGGGKGALIGSVIGAGGGTAAAAATGKKDIVLPAESRLTFRLQRPVAIQVKT